MVGVGMAVNVNGSPGQPATIDEAGVIELVTEDGVFAVDQGGDYRQVGGKAAAEHQGGLGFFPLGQGFF